MGSNLCPSKRLSKSESNFENFGTEVRGNLDMISYRKEAGERVDGSSKDRILKEYRIVEQIGKGLFSKVYLAITPQGHKVALKVIQKKNFVARESVEKIIVEKEILKRLDHKNVLKLYRTMQTNSEIFFVLEFAEKGNLLDVINRNRIPVDQIRIVLAQIIEALFYMHSNGIIYGDLKAENVLVKRDGSLKLCDFNLSGTSSILGDTMHGTVNYIAPEILAGKGRTPQSDFWSLGVLAHLLFYRKLPFRSSSQKELIDNITKENLRQESKDLQAPKPLRDLICALLHKDPRKRLGKSLREFTSHLFFNGFDWKKHPLTHERFSYTSDSSFVELMDSDEGETEPDEKIRSFGTSQDAGFLYNIENFTYENEQPCHLEATCKLIEENDRAGCKPTTISLPSTRGK
jgi:serine/threonine protein kinase